MVMGCGGRFGEFCAYKNAVTSQTWSTVADDQMALVHIASVVVPATTTCFCGDDNRVHLHVAFAVFSSTVHLLSRQNAQTPVFGHTAMLVMGE